MIDRTYLPFESTRFYQDVGMQKWMGFFISEHSSALTDNLFDDNVQSELTIEKKLLYLGQLYANQESVVLSVKEKTDMISVTGTVHSITIDSVVIKTRKKSFKNINLESILDLELEGGLHETA